MELICRGVKSTPETFMRHGTWFSGSDVIDGGTRFGSGKFTEDRVSVLVYISVMDKIYLYTGLLEGGGAGTMKDINISMFYISEKLVTRADKGYRLCVYERKSGDGLGLFL